MKDVRYRDLLLAAAIVVLGTGLGAILQPRSAFRDLLEFGCLLALGGGLVGAVSALSSRGAPRPDPLERPIPERVGNTIANVVVVLLLGMLAVVAWIASVAHPTPGTRTGVLLLFAITVFGGWFLRKRWRTAALLPFGVSAVIATLVVMAGAFLFP